MSYRITLAKTSLYALANTSLYPVFMITSSEINVHSRLHSGRNLLSGLKNVASHLGSCVGDAVYKTHWQKATLNGGLTGIL